MLDDDSYGIQEWVAREVSRVRGTAKGQRSHNGEYIDKDIPKGSCFFSQRMSTSGPVNWGSTAWQKRLDRLPSRLLPGTR